MNDKDKEAFEKWFNEERRLFESREPATYTDSDEWLMEKGWQAACEYKQNKITLLENQISWLEEQIDDFMDEPDIVIKKLQAENAKLRECVELIAGDQEFYCGVGDHNKQSLARQVLKKLDEE